MTKKIRMDVRQLPASEIDSYLRRHHYLQSVPAGARYRFAWVVPEQMFGLSCIVAAAMWGRPTARMEDQMRTLELTRFYCSDDLPKNSESRFLGAMLRILKREGWTRFISYADPAQGHKGTIYRAVGFREVGRTKRGNWGNRAGRASTPQHPKIKFELEVQG